MSQNTEHYQLITPPSSSPTPTKQNTKRLSTSSDVNTPSSPQSYTVRYRYERETKRKKNVQLFFLLILFLLPLKKKQLYKRTNETRHNVYSISPRFFLLSTHFLFHLVAYCQ